MAVDIARICRELCDWCTPSRWIWSSTRDVIRDAATSEEPDIDIVTGPLRGVDAATGGVEATAVGFCVLVLYVAASVARLSRGVVPAIGGCELTGEATVAGNGTTFGGVQGHGVVGILIDAFDYVDFALVGLPKSAFDDLGADWSRCLGSQ